MAPWAALNVVVLLSLALALEFSMSPEVAASTWRPRLLCLMLAVATALVARHGEWRRWLHGLSMALALAVALTGDWMALTVDHPWRSACSCKRRWRSC
ncbi:hypothetical protein HML84_17940 [Alcanivorax sp. IO_7]|nr:hypothetical protein HML84_17940 [Alcanivorax sp. IO_7]